MARAAGRGNDLTHAGSGGRQVSRPKRRLATFRSSMSRAELGLLPRRKSSLRWKREASPPGRRAFGNLSLRGCRPSTRTSDRAPARRHVHAPCVVLLRRRRARRSWNRVRARLRTTAARAGRRPAALSAYRNGGDHTCGGTSEGGFRCRRAYQQACRQGKLRPRRRSGRQEVGGASVVATEDAAQLPERVAPAQDYAGFPLWGAFAGL